MRQFAWLDLFGGKWLFLNGNLKYPARSWTDENVALAELQEEGWLIVGQRRRRRSMNNPRQRSYGYAMTRTIH
jgi:hypothetical protein